MYTIYHVLNILLNIYYEFEKRKSSIISWYSANRKQPHGWWYYCMVHYDEWMSLLAKLIHFLKIFSFLTITIMFGYINSFGVYQNLYIWFNTTLVLVISWIGVTQIFFLLAITLPEGKHLDIGYFYLTILIRSLIYMFLWEHFSICYSHLPTIIIDCSCYQCVIWINSSNYIFHRN